MEELVELKNIWQSVRAEEMLPTSSDAIKIARQYRRRLLIKKAMMVLILLLMTALMIYVVFYGPKMITTRIGEAGFFIGIFVLVASNAKSLSRAFNQTSQSNEEFIEYLKQGQRGRIYFYEKVQPALFLIISLSLFLYVFELVYKNTVAMIAAYLLLTVYFVLVWFIVRPRIIERKTRTLKETIERLEALSK